MTLLPLWLRVPANLTRLCELCVAIGINRSIDAKKRAVKPPFDLMNRIDSLG